MADPLGQEPGLEDAGEVIVPISSGRRLQIVATTRYRAIRAVWFGACVVDVLVGLRFLLELLGASSRSEFVFAGIDDLGAAGWAVPRHLSERRKGRIRPGASRFGR